MRLADELLGARVVGPAGGAHEVDVRVAALLDAGVERPVTNGEPPPIAFFSWNIHRVPTVQPWSTSPTRSESGTRTSVMNSWQNSLDPLIISIRCSSMPSWWIGMMNTLRPRCLGTSQLVRSRHRP